MTQLLLSRVDPPYWAIRQDCGSSWEPSMAVISVHPLWTRQQAEQFLQNEPEKKHIYSVLPVRWYDRWVPDWIWRKRLNVDMVVWVHDE
jgi:hypothetical protein